VKICALRNDKVEQVSEKLEKQGQIKEYLKNIMAEIALIIRRSE